MSTRVSICSTNSILNSWTWLLIIALLKYLFTAIFYFREKVRKCKRREKDWWNPLTWICTLWNEVLRPVGNAVYTAGDCIKQGMREIAKHGRCVKHSVKCADAGRCYVSRAAPTITKCTGGMIVPSGHCLKQNGFVNWFHEHWKFFDFEISCN